METKYEEQLKLDERQNELQQSFVERKQEQEKVRPPLSKKYGLHILNNLQLSNEL